MIDFLHGWIGAFAAVAFAAVVLFVAQPEDCVYNTRTKAELCGDDAREFCTRISLVTSTTPKACREFVDR